MQSTVQETQNERNASGYKQDNIFLCAAGFQQFLQLIHQLFHRKTSFPYQWGYGYIILIGVWVVKRAKKKAGFFFLPSSSISIYCIFANRSIAFVKFSISASLPCATASLMQCWM